MLLSVNIKNLLVFYVRKIFNYQKEVPGKLQFKFEAFPPSKIKQDKIPGSPAPYT